MRSAKLTQVKFGALTHLLTTGYICEKIRLPFSIVLTLLIHLEEAPNELKPLSPLRV